MLVMRMLVTNIACCPPPTFQAHSLHQQLRALVRTKEAAAAAAAQAEDLQVQLCAARQRLARLSQEEERIAAQMASGNSLRPVHPPEGQLPGRVQARDLQLLGPR